MEQLTITRPLSAEERKKKHEKRQAQVGLASNILGLSAAGAALGSTLRDDRLKGGGKVARGIYRAGEKVPSPVQDKIKEWSNDPKKRAKGARTAAALATGAVGLQAANMAGDLVANRVLNREAKKPVIEKRDFGSGAQVGTSLVSKRVPFRKPPQQAVNQIAAMTRQSRKAAQTTPQVPSLGQTQMGQRATQQQRAFENVSRQKSGLTPTDRFGNQALNTGTVSQRRAAVETKASQRRAKEVQEQRTRQMQMGRSSGTPATPADAVENSMAGTAGGLTPAQRLGVYSGIGAAGAFGGYQLTKSESGRVEVAKRRYDPEADRQRNQGIVTGTSAAAAPALAVVAGRQFERVEHTGGPNKGKLRGLQTKPVKDGSKIKMPRGKRAGLAAAGSLAAGGVAAASFKRGQDERNQPWT